MQRRGDLQRISESLATAATAIGRDRTPAREGARNLALEQSMYAIRDLAAELERAGDLGGAIILARTFARAVDLDRILAHSLAPTLGLALIDARDNLTAAANDFVGADLTTVDPGGFGLGGVRWDSSTRWPTPEWADRIRRTSVEDPPGSGVYIVRSEGGHHFAGRGSLAPMS
ncbi:hypothetical protein [Streptomyces sp. NBC_00162]|uniref:hypothetical protein n=1 Tax=Streptomyces sp. NBC_00162 TaxID=2903629 RepID=UPI00214C1AA7|nr:hypothetical protein [Streptomyces sp. NBC_00162]UUU44348.1 hypothetical protein JIW86_39820 [Streptomyces sp. NBC_00162]